MSKKEQVSVEEFYRQVSDELSKLSLELRADHYLSTKVHGWALNHFRSGDAATMEEAFAEAFSAYFMGKAREVK